MKNLWKKFCAWITGLWRKFVNWLLSIPANYRFFFVAGILITAFSAITLQIEWCPALALGVVIFYEFVKLWIRKDYKMNVWNIVACFLGSLPVWLDVLLRNWLFK